MPNSAWTRPHEEQRQLEQFSERVSHPPRREANKSSAVVFLGKEPRATAMAFSLWGVLYAHPSHQPSWEGVSPYGFWSPERKVATKPPVNVKFVSKTS